MKLFTKIKQAVESWIRAIVAEEVSTINTSLRSERAAFDAQVQSFKVQFDEALQSFIANSDHAQQNIKLQATIKELTEHFYKVIDAVKQIHPTMKF